MSKLKRQLRPGLFLPGIFLSFLAGSALSEEPLRVACYDIEVQLRPTERALSATEHIYYTNHSDYLIDTLYFNLYPNAFRDENSLFLKRCEKLRKRCKRENNWGRLDLKRTVLENDQVDLRSQLIPLSEHDMTVVKLPLAQSLRPRESLDIHIEFEVKLPEVIDRLGYKGDNFIIAQWFPKLGVFEGGRWRCYPYQQNTEPFADFGDYRVKITLPKEFVVAACGYLQSEKDNGDGTKTLSYQAPEVHDFGWAADPSYEIFTDSVQEIEIELYLKPDHTNKASRILSAAKGALRYCIREFGEYPYRKLTIVDTEIAGNGMELPTMITITARYFPFCFNRFEEAVTVHEVVHQWFYGMLASNQAEEAWLDEGFTTYVSAKILKQMFGEGNFVDFCGLQFGAYQMDRLTYLWEASTDPIYQPGWEFDTELSYFASTYSKASLALKTLEGYLGSEVVDSVLANYTRKFRFRHPTTSDFVSIAEEVSNQDLSWFYGPVLFGTEVSDYAVSEIKSEKSKRDEEVVYGHSIKLTRLGEMTLPVEVKIVSTDGRKFFEQWDGRGRHHQIELRSSSPIEVVVIDPERKNHLDVNFNNNSKTSLSQADTIFELQTRIFFCLESLLQWVTAF
jgi:hypothetical protein